jgi:hypothetical protein
MPAMQLLCERANALFNRENVDKVSLESVAPGTSLKVAAERLGILGSKPEGTYLDSWPAGLQEAVVGAVRSAITRRQRLPVTFSWAPAYDYEVQIWEAHGAKGSRAAMTILLRSPYP